MLAWNSKFIKIRILNLSHEQENLSRSTIKYHLCRNYIIIFLTFATCAVLSLFIFVASNVDFLNSSSTNGAHMHEFHLKF